MAIGNLHTDEIVLIEKGTCRLNKPKKLPVHEPLKRTFHNWEA